jgi:hypothetical protein
MHRVNGRQVALIGVRLLALAAFGWGVMYLAAVGAMFINTAEWVAAGISGTPTVPPWWMLSTSLPGLVAWFFAAAWWFFARSIAQVMVPADWVEQPADPIIPRGLLAVGIMITGAVIGLIGLVETVHYLLNSVLTVDRDAVPTIDGAVRFVSRELLSAIIVSGLKLAIGLWLIIGNRRVVDLLLRMRGRPPESPESPPAASPD